MHFLNYGLLAAWLFVCHVHFSLFHVCPSKMTYSRKTLEIGLDQLLCIEMLIILKIKTRRMHCKVKYKCAEFCF